MQIRMDFGSQSEDALAPGVDPLKSPKESLEEYIKVCGLLRFKDFYMKVKDGQIDNIPPTLTRSQFLMLCKEVYEKRANAIERNEGRAKFFRIKHTIRKKK